MPARRKRRSQPSTGGTKGRNTTSLLRRIRDATGAGVVLVEHDVALLRAACDRLVALDGGRVLAQGSPAEVLDDPAVVAAYLGTPVAASVAGGGSGSPH
ncbi:MAG: hypothetical protein ACRD0O_22420 [Acidimicrobiia bacterium]